MQIHEALEKLDPSNDHHWTVDGLPRVEAVGEILGRETSRQEITKAAPAYNREHPVLPGHGQGQRSEGEQVADAERQEREQQAQPDPRAEQQAQPKDDQDQDREESDEERAEREAREHREQAERDRKAREEAARKRKAELDRGRRRYIELGEEILELRGQRDRIDKQMADAIHEQARLQRFAPEPVGYSHDEDTRARIDWIRSQQANRAQRSQQFTSQREAAAAPVDAAFARKSGFGTGRPSSPQAEPPRTA